MNLDHVDIKLRDLNGEEVTMHAKKPAGVVELDAHQQAVDKLRRHRIDLLVQRNHEAAAELRRQAEGLRRQALEIRSSIRTHAEALQKLEGISIEKLPGRKSDELDRKANQLEREARQVASTAPRATGNIRAGSLDELVAAAFSDPTIIPPTIASIEKWAIGVEVQRFGQVAPQVARQFHLIWKNAEIDQGQSSVGWGMAESGR